MGKRCSEGWSNGLLSTPADLKGSDPHALCSDSSDFRKAGWSPWEFSLRTEERLGMDWPRERDLLESVAVPAANHELSLALEDPKKILL